MSVKRKIALVGTPNAGKTALFNHLTHSHQRVANYSGVTVDSAEADLILPNGELVSLVDLPGAYSLRPYTDEEVVLAKALKSDAFDCLLIVVDATQPERAIRFMIEVLDSTDCPAIVALNMEDLARERGFEIDLAKLQSLMGVTIVSTVATRKHGLRGVPEAVEKAANGPKRKKDQFLGEKRQDLSRLDVSMQILNFYKKADEILKQVLKKQGRPDFRTERIDRAILHPVLGIFILILVLGITFQLMFNLAHYPMDWIDSAFDWARESVKASALSPILKSFLADGVLAGLGGTLVFLPQIVILFALILFLEDFGFMARAVFLLDYWMGKVGLHGRAFLPLLSSYACAVPGILSTKTIENRRDRILTTLIIPLTTCSARVPVYTLLIAAFIPNVPVWGGIKLQGLVMLGLYLVGTLSALMMGALLKKFFLKGKRPPLLIELPSYKVPSLKTLFKGLAYRTQLFLNRVGTIILALTIVIWFLVSFPKPENGQFSIEDSYAARMGHVLEPAIRPLGFNWKIGMALIPTFAAREVMVSTLSTVYAVKEDAEVSNTSKLSALIKGEWSLATGLSLIAWFIFAPSCISTLATARRELKSTKWMLVMMGYLFGLAYFASWLTYHLAKHYNL